MASIAVVPQVSGVGIGALCTGVEDTFPLENLARGWLSFSPGESWEQVFVGLEGRVKVYIHGPGGKRSLLHVAELGEIVHEDPLLGEGTYRRAA